MGVVGDVREFGLDSAPQPTIYSLDVSPEVEILVKSSATDATLPSSISAVMRRINPQQAFGPVKPLNDYISASLARQRLVLALIATFAGLALCLCAIGIYGVFSYSVSRRLREFGIRSAIGAQRRDVLAQVLRESLVVICPGLLAGIGLSAACSRFLQTLLYRVSPTDPRSSILAVACASAFCLASVAMPALRATRVDPSTILREQ